jgi:4'-phosphopantetheinyl transferase
VAGRGNAPDAYLAACAARAGALDPAVDLWIDDLEEEAPAEVAAGAALDAAERARLDRAPPGPARERLLRGRGLLRAALGARLGRSPHAVPIRVEPEGRPALGGPGPAFSLSHSGRWLALAVARGPELAAVGLDIERGPSLEETLAERFGDDVLRRVFSEDERALVARAVDPGAAALRLWVRKEAALKAVGAGLRLPAAALDWSGAAPVWGPGLRALDGRWRLLERGLPDGGALAVALRAG